MLRKKLGIEGIEKDWTMGKKGSDYFKVPPTLIIPEGIEYIGFGAFANCQWLKKVVIPKSVVEIGHCAFNGCRELKEVKIPDSVEYIRENAFYFCIKLEKVVIPKSVKYIGIGAFDWCESATIILKKPMSESKFLPLTFKYCRDVKEEVRD